MKTTRIAALGDSITKGVVLNDQNRYSAAEQSFLDILSSELDLRVDNYGKFGCTVSYGNSVLQNLWILSKTIDHREGIQTPGLSAGPC